MRKKSRRKKHENQEMRKQSRRKKEKNQETRKTLSQAMKTTLIKKYKSH